MVLPASSRAIVVGGLMAIDSPIVPISLQILPVAQVNLTDFSAV